MRVETNKQNITEYSENVEWYQKLYNIHEWNTERRKKELSRRNIWRNNFWKLSEMHDKHQTTYPRSLEKLRIRFKNPYTHKHNPTLRQKSKNREQILKAVRGEKNTLPTEKDRWELCKVLMRSYTSRNTMEWQF